MASRTGFGLTSSARTGMPVGHACCSIFLTFIATVFLLAAWLSMPSTAVATEPELPRLYVNTTYVPPTGRTLAVSTGGDFQAALNAAQLGDVITLQAGATFTGPFTLPAKGARAGSPFARLRLTPSSLLQGRESPPPMRACSQSS
jgi:hypothetical protein